MEISGPNRWNSFLNRVEIPLDVDALRTRIAGKSILATGAGGFIGSAVTEALARCGAFHVVLLEADEHRLYEIHRRLAAVTGRSTEINAFLGSVCDARLLRDIFETYRPQIVFHAAAFKHVPLTEENPFAVMENNALGTAMVVEAAERFGAEQFLLLSTDKAASPRSWMGASKRIAELAVLARASEGFVAQAMRLGNVLDSPGSVVPLFREQIAAGGPVTVTHRDARRYFLTLEQVRNCLLMALAEPDRRGLLVPDMGELIRVVDLATFLIDGCDVAISFTQLRPGEKLEEQLIAASEKVIANAPSRLRQIDTPLPSNEELRRVLTELRGAIEDRDLAKLKKTVCDLVPEYAEGIVPTGTKSKIAASQA
jgi:FlaA1/EpsC-like NDP-sugar epimerase